MDMPTRIEIRQWLATKTREQIISILSEINEEHGELNEQEVRYFLNLERENSSINTLAEVDLLDDHERKKLAIKNNIESQKRLHAENKKVSA